MARRILHLVTASDPAWLATPRLLVGAGVARTSPADSGSLACAAAIRLSPRYDHRVVVIGGSRIERRLAGIGLTAVDRISPACFAAWSGRRALRRFLRAAGAFDVIQPWDVRLQAMIPTDAAGRRGRVRAAPTTDELSAVLSADGSRPPRRPDAALRSHATGPDRLPVVLFGADPPDAGDAASLFRVLGLTDKCGYRFAVVLPRGVRGAKRVTRLHRDARLSGSLIVSDRSALEWVDSSDVVLTVAVKDEREQLLRTVARARGVPVIQSPPGARTMREYFAPAATQLRRVLDGEHLDAADRGAADGRQVEQLLHSWWS